MYYLFKEAVSEDYSSQDSLIPVQKFSSHTEFAQYIQLKYFGKSCFDDLYVLDKNNNFKVIEFKRELIKSIGYRNHIDTEGVTHRIAYNKSQSSIVSFQLVNTNYFEWESE